MYRWQLRVLQSLLIVSALVLGNNQAQALPMNTRPVKDIGSNSNEAPLQQVLNSITVAGPGIDVINDQSSYALFTGNASGGAVATFIIELAGYSNTSRFGIYSSANPTNKALIFSGADGAEDQALVSFMDNGNIKVNGTTVASNFSNAFGFYLDVYGMDNTLDYTFYSEDEHNPNGAAQALIYQGDNATTLKLPGYYPGLFDTSEYIIAFEDLILSGSDKDYNDLVVLVESISPVPTPEPTTMLLLGTGLLAMAGYGWRRQQQTQ
jgi:hypothetical protein